MDDVSVIDDLIVLARRGGPAALQHHEMRAANEDVQAIVVETHAQAVADQARGDGVEHLAQREAAGRGDAHGDLFVVGRATVRQFLQFGAFDIDALGVARIHAADDLVDEAAVEAQIVELA